MNRLENQHLSDDEICRCLCGERDAEIERHLEACEQCRREVGGISEAFDGFQAKAVEESAARMAAYDVPSGISQRAGSRTRVLPWTAGAGLAAAAMVAAILMFSGHGLRRGPVEVAAKMTTQSDGDAALLKRVNADVSRTAPGPMEPLENLIMEGQ